MSFPAKLGACGKSVQCVAERLRLRGCVCFFVVSAAQPVAKIPALNRAVFPVAIHRNGGVGSMIVIMKEFRYVCQSQQGLALCLLSLALPRRPTPIGLGRIDDINHGVIPAGGQIVVWPVHVVANRQVRCPHIRHLPL